MRVLDISLMNPSITTYQDSVLINKLSAAMRVSGRVQPRQVLDNPGLGKLRHSAETLIIPSLASSHQKHVIRLHPTGVPGQQGLY